MKTNTMCQPQTFEVWRIPFAFEDNPKKYKYRPVIIGSIVNDQALIVKVTTHAPRSSCPGEVSLKDWKKAGLARPSTARCSKTLVVSLSAFEGSVCFGKLSFRDAFQVALNLKALDFID